jgi:Helix-turn-helix domain of resolvase
MKDKNVNNTLTNKDCGIYTVADELGLNYKNTGNIDHHRKYYDFLYNQCPFVNYSSTNELVVRISNAILNYQQDTVLLHVFNQGVSDGHSYLTIAKDMREMVRSTLPKPVSVKKTKLTTTKPIDKETYTEVIALHNKGHSQRAIAERVGISKSSVNRIIHCNKICA